MRTTLRTTALAAAALALGAAFTLPAEAGVQQDTTATGARALIANAGAPGTVDDSYIVLLKKTALLADSPRAERLADSYSTEITSTFDTVLNGFAVEATEAEALALAADPAVAEVVQNQVHRVAAVQPNPPSWGLDRIDQPDLPLNQSYSYPDNGGAGVTIYVVDTGIRYSHSDFGGQASFGYDAFGGNGSDGYGHGTHVAGTAAGTRYGVAKNADLVSVRVLDNSGYGTTETVANGVEWITENADGPSVANLSLGGGPDPVIDRAVRASIASGVVYAVAAGNSYGANAANYSPARVTEAITVASSASNDARSSFSNIGAVVDIYAPGTGITSAWNNSDTATSTISGTSMATPHVAGVAAIYLASNPNATPAAVRNAIVAQSEPNTVTNPGASTTATLLQVS
ncbi:S8 family peptidase [Streptomyces avicenniae]|uniref:S8 family peptidase n=1 Tax=Streptomyces avicenniae TaxID=500153 RepID=UPI00069B8D2B|nr:S8 family peptidase [Streptomyces avicenniae]